MANGDGIDAPIVDPVGTPQEIPQSVMPPNIVMGQAYPPGVIPSSSTGQIPPQQQQQPQVPQPGGMPLFVRMLQGEFGKTRPTDPSTGQPMSRGDMTLSFLGEFLSNMANGLAAAGHGPGANLRGFAGGVQAPYQRAVGTYGLEQQAAAQQAQIQGEQARTALTQEQTRMMGTSVPVTMMTPAGPQQMYIPISQLGNVMRGTGAAAINQQTKFATQDQVNKTLNEARDALGQGDVATYQAKLKEAGDLATAKAAPTVQTAAAKMNEDWQKFQASQQYLRWKTKLDDQTKLDVAQITAGKAPATLMQTAVFANGGLQTLSDAEAAMQRLEAKGAMGQSWGQNKVEDYIFGKGAVDPSIDPQTRSDIGQLRQALDLTASAMQRAHTGRGMKEMYDDQRKMMGAGQDWNALRGAMQESKIMLQHYSAVASDASVRAMRGGAAAPATHVAGGPSQGLREGQTGTGSDGKKYVVRGGKWAPQ